MGNFRSKISPHPEGLSPHPNPRVAFGHSPSPLSRNPGSATASYSCSANFNLPRQHQSRCLCVTTAAVCCLTAFLLQCCYLHWYPATFSLFLYCVFIPQYAELCLSQRRKRHLLNYLRLASLGSNAHVGGRTPTHGVLISSSGCRYAAATTAAVNDAVASLSSLSSTLAPSSRSNFITSAVRLN